MRIFIKAFHPDTGRITDMTPKDLYEYTAWVERGAARGYRAYDLGDGVIRLTSDKPGNPVVFTAGFVED